MNIYALNSYLASKEAEHVDIVEKYQAEKLEQIADQIRAIIDADIDPSPYEACMLKNINLSGRSQAWCQSDILRSAIRELVCEYGVDRRKMLQYIACHCTADIVCGYGTAGDDIIDAMHIGEVEHDISDLIDDLTPLQIERLSNMVGDDVSRGLIYTNTSDCVVLRLDLDDMLAHFGHDRSIL